MGDDTSDRGTTLYPAGETVDGYEIQRRIGYGSTSDVYEATELATGKVVALKVLNQKRLRDPQARTRFQREAAVHALIRHRNVAPIYGSGITAANEPYLVLELFVPRCLRDVLNDETIDVARACSYVLQALDGLRACHAAGVRHRDLKPENMMLRPSDSGVEHVVLIDFGFATFDGQRRLTAEGFVVGSMSYVAPERLQGEPGDARADIYSMGAVLFELLTGRPLFKGDDLEVAHQHLDTPAPPPSEVVPQAGISAELDAVVLNSLAKDPAERYQSADAMAEALSRAILPSAADAADASGPQPFAADLVYCDVDGVERVRTLGDGPILIGRAPECAVRSEDPLVSRQHARVYWGSDGNYRIDDLDSTNGVWVGVERVDSAAIPTDEIAVVGSLVVEIRPRDQPADDRQLRQGIHTRLWSWLKAERAGRAAIETERNALARRVGELHGAVEQLSADSADASAVNLSNELRLLRDNASELRSALVAAETQKDEIASDLADARREFSKALNKHMADLFKAQSTNAELAQFIDNQRIELEDAVGKLRTRDATVASLRQDIEALSGVAAVGAQQETLALVAAQAKAGQLADRVAELEDVVEDLRRDLAANDSAAADEDTAVARVAELETQVGELSQELERVRWSRHQDHAAEVRLKLQLESALAEVGQLRRKDTDPGQYTANTVSRLELGNAAQAERIAELEGELDNARTGVRSADDETVRLREQLLGARAEVEAAWAEVEHLRRELDSR